MTIDDYKICDEVGKYDRILVISIRAVYDQRDEAMADRDEWKARALAAEAKLHAKYIESDATHHLSAKATTSE